MKLGIIGCGLIGQKRAQAGKKLGLELVSACDLNIPAAQDLANRFGGQAVNDYRDVLSSDADILVVAVTHDKLAQIALEAVKAGKHLLLEKPGAVTSWALEPVLEEAIERNLSVKVGYNHRFHPSLQKARELVDQGALGQLMYVRGRYGHGGRLGYEKEWRMRREIGGGGELLDQGSHLIDLSLWFLGGFATVQAQLPNYYWKADVEDNAFLLLTTSLGQCAMLHATWTEWKNMFSFEIVGQLGKIAIDGLGGSYGPEQIAYHKMLPEMGPPETVIWQYPFPDQSWEKEFEELTKAIDQKRQPQGGLGEAIEVLRLIDIVYAQNRK
ncbi:MAG: Gfo/Idh/MocA family oxidoreductase [Deltaproteobacteria bacterium]|jgi:predicted dehydrogenase|nr:Gfo/Idh/MocA family oxidoreductase [Deltaproteobacteria bacterium]